MDQERIITDYLRGQSSKGYEVFGAHPTSEKGSNGVRFTVYAPNAAQVSLIGSFNGWNDGRMERRENGVWSAFAEGAQEGDMYKFRIRTGGVAYDRADPFACYSQLRPDTASIVWDLNRYLWKDYDWMASRDKNFNKPLNLYEVHAGSWKVRELPKGAEPDQRFYHYEELADRLIPYVKQMGYTHIELMPLTEYPFDGSWGYQVTGYFSATSRYGEPRQLMNFVDRCHQSGIGVVLDFVPAHFVQDFYALHLFDGGCLYESQYEEQRYSEWGTAYFDFTKPHVCSFLRSALDFWIEKYHFDGIRYDAVSNLIYQHGHTEGAVNEPGIWFLKSTNYALQTEHPDVMLIAEDSSHYLKVTAPVVYGGLGFDYKWCLGWMHDTLDYMALPFNQRGANRNKFTFSMSYFYNDIFILPLSHDEVVHGKRTVIDKIYGNYEEKFSQLRCLYLYMFSHPGKKLNFMGNELAEFKEWDEAVQLGWNLQEYPLHQGFMRFFQALQDLYLREPALSREDYNIQGFQWLNAHGSEPEVFAMMRDSLIGEQIYTVVNLSNRRCCGYRLPVREPGVYLPLLQTEEAQYGGQGQVLEKAVAYPEGGARAAAVELVAPAASGLDGKRGCYLTVDLPPMSGCMLKRASR